MKKTVAVIVLLLLSPNSYARKWHLPHVAVGSDRIVVLSQEQIDRLVEDKKVDESWKKATLVSKESKQVSMAGAMRWIVIYSSSVEKNKSKATLKLDFTLDGKFVEYEIIPK